MFLTPQQHTIFISLFRDSSPFQIGASEHKKKMNWHTETKPYRGEPVQALALRLSLHDPLDHLDLMYNADVKKCKSRRLARRRSGNNGGWLCECLTVPLLAIASAYSRLSRDAVSEMVPPSKFSLPRLYGTCDARQHIAHMAAGSLSTALWHNTPSRKTRLSISLFVPTPRLNTPFSFPALNPHTATPYFHLLHPSSHTLALLPCPNPPVVPTHSVNGLAYSIGTPPPLSGILQVPVFIMPLRNNLPPSPTPVRSSSLASAMALYWRCSSSSRARRWPWFQSDQARWMVQWRRARLREKRRGRGVRVVGWWRKWRIMAVGS